MDFNLVYTPCKVETDDMGRKVDLGTLDVYADSSFAPGGRRGHQGLLAMWGGCLVQWDSRQQAFGTLSSTESELLGYTDAMVLGEAVGSIVNILTENQLASKGRYTLRGDNLSGIQLHRAPDGPWRTRHLRLRSFVLRERIKAKLWEVEHVPGARLAADLLTKTVVASAAWQGFYDFAQLRNVEEPADTSKVEMAVKALMAFGLVAASNVVQPVIKMASLVGGMAVTAWLKVKGMNIMKKFKRQQQQQMDLEQGMRPRLAALRAPSNVPIWEQERFRQPDLGRDRWERLSEGFWVRCHGKWRHKTFHPLHKSAPFEIEDLRPERTTVVFTFRDGQFSFDRVVHHDMWATEPKAFGPRNSQWKGFTFFQVRQEERYGGVWSQDLERSYPMGQGQAKASAMAGVSGGHSTSSTIPPRSSGPGRTSSSTTTRAAAGGGSSSSSTTSSVGGYGGNPHGSSTVRARGAQAMGTTSKSLALAPVQGEAGAGKGKLVEVVKGKTKGDHPVDFKGKAYFKGQEAFKGKTQGLLQGRLPHPGGVGSF